MQNALGVDGQSGFTAEEIGAVRAHAEGGGAPSPPAPPSGPPPAGPPPPPPPPPAPPSAPPAAAKRKKPQSEDWTMGGITTLIKAGPSADPAGSLAEMERLCRENLCSDNSWGSIPVGMANGSLVGPVGQAGGDVTDAELWSPEACQHIASVLQELEDATPAFANAPEPEFRKFLSIHFGRIDPDFMALLGPTKSQMQREGHDAAFIERFTTYYRAAKEIELGRQAEVCGFPHFSSRFSTFSYFLRMIFQTCLTFWDRYSNTFSLVLADLWWKVAG